MSASDNQQNPNEKHLKWLQLFIDDHFGFDISMYSIAELKSMSDKLIEAVTICRSLGQPDDILDGACEYTSEEAAEVGYVYKR